MRLPRDMKKRDINGVNINISQRGFDLLFVISILEIFVNNLITHSRKHGTLLPLVHCLSQSKSSFK